MTPLVFWLALACGIDAGYEPAPDGHLEYIIQIEPELVGKLASGHDLISEVPRGLDIRHYRVTIGTAVLPKNAVATRPAAGGETGQAANQFEAPGRSDEVIGSTTPGFRAQYQAGSGQVAIEIAPASLVDLNEHDLTGDIRPGLMINRFVVSTRPGTVADAIPAGWNGDVTPTRAAMPPVVETGASAADGDPSVWKSEPASGPVGGSTAPAGTGAAPSTAAGGAVGVGPGGTGPSSAGSGGTGPAAQGGISSLGPPLADDDPGGSEKPPAAMPPPAGQEVEPPSTSPLLGEPSNLQGHSNPSGNNFRHHGGTSGEATGSGYGSGAAAAPAPLPTGTESTPLNASGVHDNRSREPQFDAKLPHDPALTTPSEKPDNPAAKTPDSSHKETEPQTIPYLPLAIVTFGFIFSLGVNVFLGWHVWESYNRGRTAVHAPPAEKHHEKRHERKTSLAH